MTAPTLAVERTPYPLKTRLLTVLRVEELSSDMRRIILGGEDLEATLPHGQFSPADHVRLVLPNADTGEVTMPTIDESGLNRPDGVELREYTIRWVNAEKPELAIDFLLHEHGPAGRWAIAAKPGDLLGVLGPRGSARFPTGYDRYLLVGDETALPAIERWLEEAPREAALDVFVLIEDASRERELPVHPRASLRWLHRANGQTLGDAVATAMPNLEANTFLWAASEATSLLPIRKQLRELGHAKQAIDIRGYWKIGESEHKESK